MARSRERGFPQLLAVGMMTRGWAMALQGQGEAGMAQLHQGLAAFRAAGAELDRPRWLTLLVEAYGQVEQTDEGLTVLAEALATAHTTGERRWDSPSNVHLVLDFLGYNFRRRDVVTVFVGRSLWGFLLGTARMLLVTS
jgi:hypothetical protein